jgi:hypothetical protein
MEEVYVKSGQCGQAYHDQFGIVAISAAYFEVKAEKFLKILPK